MQLFVQDPLVKLTHPLKAQQETHLLILGLYYCPHCYSLPLEISPNDLQSPQMTSNKTLFANSMKVTILWLTKFCP